MYDRIIILGGQAGSGKDTVGNYLAQVHGAVTLGQADPMKRFAQNVFGFTEEQLWGPSECRNARDPRFDNIPAEDMTDLLDGLDLKFAYHARTWLKEVLPAMPDSERGKALMSLDDWFSGILRKVARHEGLTPRLVLQTLGTEWGRQFSLNMWSDLAIDAARNLLAGDMRYSRTHGLKPVKGAHCNFAIITDGRFENEFGNVRARNGLTVRIIRPDSNLSSAAEASGVQGHKSERELNGIPDDAFDLVLVNDGTLQDLYGMVDEAIKAFYPAA